MGKRDRQTNRETERRTDRQTEREQERARGRDVGEQRIFHDEYIWERFWTAVGHIRDVNQGEGRWSPLTVTSSVI